MNSMNKLRLIWVSLFFICAVVSCKKESDDSRIIGEWEIRSYAGGLLPSAQFPAGNGQVLKFTATDYVQIKDGQILKSGTYKIIEEKFWEGNYRIIFDEDLQALPTYLKISDNKLTIFTGAPVSLDGLETIYVRK